MSWGSWVRETSFNPKWLMEVQLIMESGRLELNFEEEAGRNKPSNGITTEIESHQTFALFQGLRHIGQL